MGNTLFAIKQITSLLDTKSKFTFLISYILFILQSSSRVITATIFALIIAKPDNLNSGLLWGVIAYGGIFSAASLVGGLQYFLSTLLNQNIRKKLLLKAIDVFFTAPLSVSQNKSVSEYAVIIDRGVNGLMGTLSGIIFSFIPIFVEILIIAAIVGFRTNWGMALLIWIILTSFIFITLKLSKRIRELKEEVHKVGTNNYKIFSESLRSYETIRSFEQNQWAKNRNQTAIDFYIQKVMKVLKPDIILGLTQGAHMALLAGSIIGSVFISDAPINEKIVNIILMNTLLLFIISPLISFSTMYDELISNIASARQFIDMLKVVPSKVKTEHLEYSGKAEFKITNLIVKHDERTTLDINELLIPKQKLITISGPSGSGKTTLAKCLAGLNEYEGEIYSKQKTEHIFFMTQDVHVFDTTVEENIILGLPMDTDKFNWALKHAGISEEEYQTLEKRGIGEGGANISGGQRQRIGIARMLYHEAEVMIFDEPTASLDDTSAYQVIDTLRALSKEKTCIVVTHDARFEQTADINFKIQNGKIIN